MQDEELKSETDQAFFTEVHIIRAALLIIVFAVVSALLYIGKSILIPTILAIFLSYILSPIVAFLSKIPIPGTRHHIPRGVSSMVVVLFSVSLIVVLGIFIVEQVAELGNELPDIEQAISQNLADVHERVLEYETQFQSYMEPIRSTAAPEIEPTTDREMPNLFEETTKLWTTVSSYVFGSISSILEFTGQALMCLFVLFFILLEGPVMKVKAINVLGTTLRRRRIVLEILHNVNSDVQRYLFNRVVTNIVLALLVSLTFYVYGLKYAFLLGVLAGIFNLVPYVGPAVGSIFPVIIAYVQYGDWKSVLWVFLIYGFMTGVEGNLVTPIVLGKHMKLNSLAVLLACIFWGWLWGPIGLFLAVPILAVIKAMSEHVEEIKPMGELLRG